MNSRRLSTQWPFLRPMGALACALLAVLVLLAPRPNDARSAGPCDAPITNAIACENSLPGNPSSEWDISGSGDPSIQGFATQMSVDQGQTVRFKVDTPSSNYRIEIYRLGYYQGDGARLVATLQPTASLPQSQPNCVTNMSVLLVDCGNWGESGSWAVPADAVSGVYIAKLVREDGGNGSSHVVFIVRDDDGGSDLLFQTSDTTWQAYNSYGGSSLYRNWSLGGPLDRAYKVSYNRPFNARDDIGGLGPRSYLFASEYPMLRWLEANGYDVSYTSGVDTDLRGGELLEHDVFLSVGHDEYWSGTQRTAVEAARAAGVHLAFFSGNEVFWKTRWENSIDGAGVTHRTLVSYKETKAGAKIDPSPEWTGTWRDPRFSPPSDGGRPENALTGTLFTVNGVRFDEIAVPAAYKSLRFWRNTSVAQLQPGQTATFEAGTLGYEWDEDPDNGFRNAGQIRMSSATVAVPEQLQDYGDTYAAGIATHHLTMYRHASGALVFGAGTAQWSWGLDGEHDIINTTADPRMQQATVNLFADMDVQPGALQAGLVAATASTDTTAPTAVITSPGAGTNFETGTPVTIFGTASDAGGGVVAGIEVSTDDGATWHLAVGTAAWTYNWTPNAIGATTIRARATDDSLNTQAPVASVDVTVGIRTCPCSIWAPTDVPTIPTDSDTSSVELGVKFRTSVDGYISGVRFYKGGPSNGGTHTGSLWTSSGALLANATFTSETGTGWQQVLFAAPVAVTANTTYVASYYAPNGAFAADHFFFGSGVDNTPLRTLSDSESGGNGVFRYGASAFPTQSFQASNYWVDVVFETSGVDTIAPIIAARAPQVNATKVDTMANVTATFSEPVNAASISFVLRDAANVVVPATVTYDAPTRTATLNPSAELLLATTYSVAVSGAADAAGNVMAPDAWTFSTPGCPCSLWDTMTPTLITDGDGQPVELGVKFRSDTDGFISGVRFYKGPGNTGTHTGSLWTLGGALLGSGTFTNETALGWQQMLFASPIPVNAGTTYVVSYYTPSGLFSKTPGYFTASGFASAPLYAFSDAEAGGNGVYKYGPSGFPTSTFNASNYFVDVVFSTTGTDTVPPSVIGRSPAANAIEVPPGTNVAATFSEAVTPASILFEVRDGANALVAASLSYDSVTRVATLDPTAPLLLGTSYTATVSGATDLGGSTMTTPATWTFTTPSCPCSVWENSPVPSEPSMGDIQAVELGLKFRAETDLTATGVRFYKGAANTGTHIGSLWTSGGALLSSVTFTNETAGGWQQASFGSPVPLTAGETYVVSYYAPNGGYARNEYYFTAGITNSPLYALSSAESGGNGVFQYGPSSFPTQSFNSSNYWVDIVIAGTAPSDTTPPTVTAQSPTAGASGVSTAANVTAAFSEDVQPGTISFVLRNSSNAVIASAVSYAAGTRTVTLDPTASLSSASTYTATLSGTKDIAGNTMETVAWSFTTGDSTPPTVTSRSPASGATGVSATANTTATFSEAVQSATISFVLRNASNAVVSSVVSYSTSTLTATLNPSSSLASGATYTATLSGAADIAGNAMTPVTWSFTTADVTAPTVASRSPASAATGVNATTNVTATFNEAIQPATVSFVLRNSSNSVISSVVSYDAATFTATLNPNTSLGSNARYTATLSAAKDIAGNTMATVTWSFTTADVVAPTITARSPASNATNVSRSANITATFSEAISPSSSISITLRELGGSDVAGVLTYDSGNRRATFNPGVTLKKSKIYIVTVSGARDASGNVMSTVTWMFMTSN